MKFTNLIAVSSAAMAFSANAALFVTSSTSTGANAGIAPDSFLPPAIVIFSPTTSGTLTSLGLFDNGGNGFGGHAPGFTVSLWQNTTGNEGTELRSAAFTPSSAGTLAGDGNEWRLQAVTSVSLSAGTTYALVVRDNGNPGAGLFSGFGAGNHGAGDSTLTEGVSASYNGITVSAVLTRSFAGNPTDIFLTSGAGITSVSTSQYRFATADFTAVPEPSTYALVAGAGLAGFGLWRRRSTKA